MQVVNLLDEIMAKAGLDDKALANRIGVDPRTIKRLRLDADEWRLSRTALQRLMLFAYGLGYRHGLFEIRPVPVWNNFAGSEAILYREDRTWDANVEAGLRGYLATIDSKASMQVLDQDGDRMTKEQQIERVFADMKEKNCIFLGSPKHSFGTEIALALLWGAQPFEGSAANSQRIPIHFLGMKPEHRFGKSAILDGGSRPGFRIRPRGLAKDLFVPVDRFSKEKFEAYEGEARDASAVVVCHQPLGTEADVTTIVIAGYSGLATSLATEQLISGEPPLPPPDSSEPWLSIFKFNYFKRPHKFPALVGTVRDPIEQSFGWGPPWKAVVSIEDVHWLENNLRSAT